MNSRLYGQMVVFTLLAAVSFTGLAEIKEEMEEVVVTGSLIRGTAVDTALPVEVYSSAELQYMGGPTALEFVKNLTASAGTTGEAYYFTGAELTSDVGFNLRGLGVDKTLTLFNGRRLGGNVTNGAANTNILPGIAFSRVEILKDGAAVTYGADATAGVVNYITRETFVGFEANVSTKYYSGSDGGDQSLAVLLGFGEGDTNFMFAAEWDHRNELDSTERDFSSQPYAKNPAPWSTLTNLAGYYAAGALPETPGFGSPPGEGGATNEWGPTYGFVSDFTQSSCEAVGGVYVDGYTCKYGYVPFYNIVEENDTYRLYLQLNSIVNENMNFHMQAAWARVHTANAIGSPAQPVIRGPAQTGGAAYQFYIPMTNPYVSEFAARSGLDQNPYYAYMNGLYPVTYRAFAHSGNPTFASGGNYGVPTEIDRRYFNFSTGINGDLDYTIEDQPISYDVAITYNHWTEEGNWPDVIGYRMQEAMSGFGGADCNVPDLDPNRLGTQNAALAGTGSCQWWNPFASGWQGQPVHGLSNPSYVSGNENPDDLVRWIFNKREYENILWNATFDLTFSGATPINLPGGTVQWGAGLQWRTTKFRESVPDPLYNGRQPCAWPGQDPGDADDADYTGCTLDEPGPFVFFATNIPESASQDQSAFFAQVDLPILETWHITVAGRYEEFTGDLSADVYKVSTKWAATENLSLRGSYGTNYQAPNLGLSPGEINNYVRSYTRASGNWRGAQQVTLPGIEPETATVWSAGIIWQSAGFTDDSEFSLILDYWDIETEDEIGLLASENTIANAVFSIAPDGSGGPIPNDGTALADCSHSMIDRVTFNGTCVQGVTSANDFSNIRMDYGNGPGQHTAGYDMQLTYSIPAFAGDLVFKLNVTKVETFDFTPTVLDGVVLKPAEDRLGTLNFETIAFAAPEWRANLSANYARDNHNLRFVINYTSGVDDERYTVSPLTPAGFQTGTTTPFEVTNYGVRGDAWISTDLHYNLDMSWATLSASIVNLLDEDPPESLQELGYDPRIGSPLGRTFEIGLRKVM